MSFRHPLNHIILLAAILSRSPLLAQPAPDTIHISEVKIFRQEIINKKVYSFSELDSQTLNRNLTDNLSNVLLKYSTIYVKSTGRGTLSTASFRGTDASHTKICWNGLVINSPMLGQTDLSLIPALFLDNVSLYHGGSSLASIPGALGGIIALDNKPEWNDRSRLTLINEIASFGTYLMSAKLDLKKNNWISKSRVFYNYSENDYPFYNKNVFPPEKQRLQNSRFSGYGYLQEFYFRTRKDDLFSARLWLQHSDRALPQPLSREVSDARENQADGNVRSVISWKHYGKKAEYEISSGIISGKILYALARSDDGNLNIDSRSRENSFMNRADCDFKFNDRTAVRMEALYNYYDVSISEKIHAEGYKAVRSELNLMAGLNRDFGKRFSSYLLVRSGLIDKDFVPLMPSAGLSFRLLNKTALYLKTNLSRNYNAPRLNDMYWIPGGNPGLKPEESYTADIALDFEKHKGLFTVVSGITGYFSRIDNWIMWRPTQYQYWAPMNVSLVHSRGLEFSIKTSTEFDQTKIILQANYNFCKITDSGGRQLIYVPVHNANSLFGLNFRGYRISCQVMISGKRFTQTQATEENPETILEPFLITDLNLGKELNLQKLRLDVNFSILNLLNDEYQVVLARPMPGRNYSLSLGMSF